MKTIFDAVNELKADLGNTHCYNPSDSFFLYYDTGSKSNNWASFLNHNDVANSQFTFVGDINEFNALVDAMSTNFGECSPLNVSDYKIVIKTLLKPEPTKPESKTYTQEMADNGVLPSVGMECLAKSSRGTDLAEWSKGKIKYKSLQLTVFEVGGCIEICCNALLGNGLAFKPLTPPVPLIDGEAYQFDHVDIGSGLSGIYDDNGKVLWKGGNPCFLASCTNIQPLTLAGE